MEQPGYEKRGYLHEDFHLFHLCDAMREPVDWHYHTFHKLCVYLGGDAIRYGIEGRRPDSCAAGLRPSPRGRTGRGV